MRRFLLVLIAAALAAGVSGALPAPASLEPAALAQAEVIRAELDARYRKVSGRTVNVTEASRMDVVASITLLTADLTGERVVSADDGIYFALCSVRARCPHPVRAASWPPLAFLPRRLALELALRTFRETAAQLVVVALPTASPLWVVFERGDLLSATDVSARLAAPAGASTPSSLLALVGALTRPRLFVPIGIVPVSATSETMLALPLLP